MMSHNAKKATPESSNFLPTICITIHNIEGNICAEGTVCQSRLNFKGNLHILLLLKHHAIECFFENKQKNTQCEAADIMQGSSFKKNTYPRHKTFFTINQIQVSILCTNTELK